MKIKIKLKKTRLLVISNLSFTYRYIFLRIYYLLFIISKTYIRGIQCMKVLLRVYSHSKKMYLGSPTLILGSGSDES